MVKVLCTGGAGFLGSHLVDRLVDMGHDVHVWDNLSTGKLQNVPKNKPNCIFGKVDINNQAHMMSSSNSIRFDCVFHLAAQINLRESFKDPALDANTNVLGTLKLLHVLRTQGSPDCKFIFSSTGGAIYSPDEKLPWSENHAAIPESPYGISKLAVENYLRVLAPNSAIMRLANVYGPRQNPHGEAGVIAIFLDNMLKDKPIKVFGDGLQTRDFVYVDDVVDALILAMEKDIKGTYNVSTADRIDVNTIAKQLIRLTGKTDTVIENHPAIKGELRHSALSYHLIKAKWGWRPKTSLIDGLEHTIKYYK